MKKVLILSLFYLSNIYLMPASDNQWKMDIEFSRIESARIPFQNQEGILFVKARLNGQEQNFILDTGAPTLILNAAYVEEGIAGESAKGVSGETRTQMAKVQSFDWMGIQADSFEVMSMDLSHLERVTGLPFAGLIGHALVKDYEILIDYEASELFLFSQGIGKYHQQIQPKKEAVFTYLAHIPILKCMIGGKSFYLGIDTGASENLINEPYFKDLPKSELKLRGKEDLSGANKEQTEVQLFSLSSLWLDEQVFKDMSFVTTDISHLQGPGERLDGLLGYPFLSQKKISINFPKQKIYFWE
ncbi:MAG: pepsin/retropepsin-like aspartic protease family protein [Bacteroidota bacterium]